jgi:hypothetical protein
MRNGARWLREYSTEKLVFHAQHRRDHQRNVGPDFRFMAGSHRDYTGAGERRVGRLVQQFDHYPKNEEGLETWQKKRGANRRSS